MITINTVPYAVQFAGNPIRYKATSDNFIESAGVKAKFTFSFTATDTTVDHYITLNLMNKSLTFYLKATLTDLGTDLPVAEGGWSINQWCDALYAAFLRNYELFTFYNISLLASPPKIQFEAKETGDFYSIAIEENTIVGLQSDGASTYDGEDTVYRQAFGILLQIWDEDFDLINEDLKGVDLSGEVLFNIADYLNSFLMSSAGIHLEYPSTPGDNVVEYRDFFKKFKASFAERYSGVNHRLLFETNFHQAILGALSHEGLLYWNQLAPDYWNYAANKLKYLTWQPRTKKTSYDSPERLYFAFQDPSTYSQFRVKINIWLENGSTSSDFLNDLTDITPYSVVELVVGAAHLDLDDTVIKWNIVIINEDDDAISEVFTFQVDPKYYEQDRIFIFRNSFETYDVFRCTGIVESRLDYDLEKGSLVMEEIETPWNAPTRTLEAKETAAFKASSGWLTREAKNWLRDFMVSKERFEVVDGKLWPIVITSKKTGLFKDKDNNYALEFDYERAYDSGNYTKVLL